LYASLPWWKLNPPACPPTWVDVAGAASSSAIRTRRISGAWPAALSKLGFNSRLT